MNWYKKAQQNNDYTSLLTEQARKYDNVNDFIQSQGTPAYHGTSSDFNEFDINLSGSVNKSDWGKGIYLTNSPGSADYYRREAIKNKDEELNELYKKYDDLVRNLPPVSSVNSTPAYTEESKEALKLFQQRAQELNNTNEDVGKIVEVYISPGAKIMKHNVVDGITDFSLAQQAIDRNYDIILVDEGRMMEEIVVVNPDVIKTREQLIQIWKSVHELV